MKAKFSDENHLCLCGSGKMYLNCCKGKQNPFESEGVHKRFMQTLDKYRRNYKKICLHPDTQNCDTTKTHAHTISQAAVLELIACDSVVLMPVMYGIENSFKMMPMGIESQASKFYCFCHKHDGMFKPIDVKNAEINCENIFLYAYRNFSSTYYKVIREIDCFERLIENYDVNAHPLAVLANQNHKRQLSILKWYKNKFDEAISTGELEIFESAIITLNYKVYVAAATCLCLMFDLFGNEIEYHKNDMPLIFASVIPHEEQTKIVFSWLKQDNAVYGFLKQQFEIAPLRFILKYLNNLLPLSCENMTLSPLLWEHWSKEARNEFILLGHEHLQNQKILNISKSYFADRQYNIFLGL